MGTSSPYPRSRVGRALNVPSTHSPQAPDPEPYPDRVLTEMTPIRRYGSQMHSPKASSLTHLVLWKVVRTGVRRSRSVVSVLRHPPLRQACSSTSSERSLEHLNLFALAPDTKQDRHGAYSSAWVATKKGDARRFNSVRLSGLMSARDSSPIIVRRFNQQSVRDRRVVSIRSQ